MAPHRLALEATTLGDVEHGLTVVCDLLRRGLTTMDALTSRYQLMTHWPYTLATDVVLRLADPRFASLGEVRAFHLFFKHGLPMPELQYEIRDASGQVIATVDFAWPEQRFVVELDSQRFHGDWAAAERDRERDQSLALAGWACHRFTRRAAVGEPGSVAGRLRALWELHRSG